MSVTRDETAKLKEKVKTGGKTPTPKRSSFGRKFKLALGLLGCMVGTGIARGQSTETTPMTTQGNIAVNSAMLLNSDGSAINHTYFMENMDASGLPGGLGVKFSGTQMLNFQCAPNAGPVDLSAVNVSLMAELHKQFGIGTFSIQVGKNTMQLQNMLRGENLLEFSENYMGQLLHQRKMIGLVYQTNRGDVITLATVQRVEDGILYNFSKEGQSVFAEVGLAEFAAKGIGFKLSAGFEGNDSEQILLGDLHARKGSNGLDAHVEYNLQNPQERGFYVNLFHIVDQGMGKTDKVIGNVTVNKDKAVVLIGYATGKDGSTVQVVGGVELPSDGGRPGFKLGLNANLFANKQIRGS